MFNYKNYTAFLIIAVLTAFAILSSPPVKADELENYTKITCMPEFNMVELTHVYIRQDKFFSSLELSKGKTVEEYRKNLREKYHLSNSSSCLINGKNVKIEVRYDGLYRGKKAGSKCSYALMGEIHIYEDDILIKEVPFSDHCKSTHPLILIYDELHITYCHNFPELKCQVDSLIKLRKTTK